MANWKKIITSGSNAELNEVTASGGINGTLDTITQNTVTTMTGLTTVGTVGTGIWNSAFGANSRGLISGSWDTESFVGLSAAGISGSYLGEGYISSSGEIASEISGAFTEVSGGYSTRVTNLESSAHNTAEEISGSWQGQNFISSSGEIESEISGAFTEASGGFSSRTTTLEGNPVFSSAGISGSWQGQNFISSSGEIASEISGAFTEASGGFSTRTTTLEGNPVFSSAGISGSFGNQRVGTTDNVIFATLTNASAVNASHLTGSFSGSFSGSFDGINNLIDTFGTPANNELATWTDGDTLTGESALQFTGTTLSIVGDGAKVEFFDSGGEHISADNAGVLSIAAGTEIDLTATTIDINGAVDISGNTTIGGDLVVNGTTTTITSTTIAVADAFIFNGSGSHGTNTDGGLVVQSGSDALSGSAIYHDIDSQRWAVGKGVASSVVGVNAVTNTEQNGFVVTVKNQDLGGKTPGLVNNYDGTALSASYGIGEIIIDTTGTNDIWILGS